MEEQEIINYFKKYNENLETEFIFYENIKFAKVKIEKDRFKLYTMDLKYQTINYQTLTLTEDKTLLETNEIILNPKHNLRVKIYYDLNLKRVKKKLLGFNKLKNKKTL